MSKQTIVSLLRRTRLLTTAEKMRFAWDVLSNIKSNSKFAIQHPAVPLPPSWVAYDAYSSTNRNSYWKSGIVAADEILKYVPIALTSDTYSLLEWGCGPGRILRHLRTKLPTDSVKIYGTDYNTASIRWCEQHLAGIEFSHNNLYPPLTFESGHFDFVYCTSVFTHLPDHMFLPWLNELLRIVKVGGHVLITLNGDRFKGRLLPDELEHYERFGWANRGSVYEGSRLYLAFHNRQFVENVCGETCRIIGHDTDPSPHLSGGQDVYLLEKSGNA
jgi:SAM-dependent methyltransferase